MSRYSLGNMAVPKFLLETARVGLAQWDRALEWSGR